MKWRGWLVVLLLVPAWELLRRGAAVSPQLMPPIAEILGALVDGVVAGSLPAQVATSLFYIVLGMAAAVAAALLTVVLTAISPVLDEAFSNLGALLHPLPGIVLLPVIVLWAGIGPAAVLVVIFHSVYWPVLTNLHAGYRSIPGTWRMVANNFGVRGGRFVLEVALPGMTPYLLAGVRIAWARAWRALISAEILFGAVAGAGGLGWYIHSRRVFMDTSGLFAGIIVIMAVGSIVESVVFRVLETATVRRWGMST